MSDDSKSGQLTFDFDDFSASGNSSGGNSTGKKSHDDLTPGLFYPVVSEEEEMMDFLRKIHHEEPETPEVSSQPEEPDFPFNSSSQPVSSVAGREIAKDAEKPVSNPKTLSRKQLKQAALAFLASLQPSGLAVDVTVKSGRIKAGAAAFWLEAGRVTRTVLVEIRTDADASLEILGNAEQFEMLKLARLEKEMLEQEIRRTEPELRDSALLFSEFEEWDYAAAKNPAYQECLQKIRRLEHAVFHGSRLERLRNSNTASELYLLVPEHAVSPDSLADGWGLVSVKPDLSFELIRKPAVLGNIPEQNQIRLALKIAEANLDDVLFARGIHSVGGIPVCGPLPRRRHLKN